jgi:hypothetical protein
MIEKLKEYINNGIKLGRHRWVFQIHLLDTLDEIELLNAGLFIFKYIVNFKLLKNRNLASFSSLRI